jgi:hypothetical protein
MTDDKPTRQAIAVKERSGKLTVSGKLKVAIDLMLFEGSCRADAATAAGMKDHSLREAMKKPHVKQYYNAGLDVLRTSERARNISALAKVRDTSDNGMAVVSAAKALEQIAEQGEERTRPGIGMLPGLQIVIVSGSSPPRTIGPEPPQTIDVTPNRHEEGS